MLCLVTGDLDGTRAGAWTAAWTRRRDPPFHDMPRCEKLTAITRQPMAANLPIRADLSERDAREIQLGIERGRSGGKATAGD